MYRNYEITYLENTIRKITLRAGETIEEVLMAFITANRMNDITVLGINEI